MQPVSSFDNTCSLLYHIHSITESQLPRFGDIGIQAVILLRNPFHSSRFMLLHVFPLGNAPAHCPLFVSYGIKDVGASDTARELAVVRLSVDDLAADYTGLAARCIFVFDTFRILFFDAVLAVIAILLTIRRWNKRFATYSTGNRFPFNIFHVGLLITGPAAFPAAEQHDLSDLLPAAVSAEVIINSHNRSAVPSFRCTGRCLSIHGHR